MNLAKLPDPRVTTNWCRRRDRHDHTVCGNLWDPSTHDSIQAATQWCDNDREARRMLMRIAADHLRNPYLCNWDPRVASAIANLLDFADGSDDRAVALAETLLTSFGVVPDQGPPD